MVYHVPTDPLQADPYSNHVDAPLCAEPRTN